MQRNADPSPTVSRRQLLSATPTLFLTTACGALPFAASSAMQDREQGIVTGPLVRTLGLGAATVRFEAPETSVVRVDWGASPRLDRSVTPLAARLTDKVAPRGFGTAMFEATLEGLTPGARYHYRVVLNGEPGLLRSARTAPAPGTRRPFRFVVYSDTQHQPEVHRKLVEQGMLTLGRGDSLIEDEVAFVLIAGDLVEHGHMRSEWKDLVFEPLGELTGRVPVYAVLGNHEDDAELYFSYLGLPRTYAFTYDNCRFLALDTNTGQHTDEQLAWLDAELAAAAVDPAVDFVFAYFHHPFKSEIWPEGEIPYSGEIVRRLEATLAVSGKAGAYFFGHAHAYSRGQSKDCRLYWVNAGSGGGRLDRFGALPQTTYPEYQRTFDEYGFVAVEVNFDGAAAFRATRYSFGNEDRPRDGEVQDVFGADVVAAQRATTIDDPLEAEWQFARDLEFTQLLGSTWRRREKVSGESVQVFALADASPGEAPDGAQFVRKRYRDDQLAWTAWSSPTPLKS